MPGPLSGHNVLDSSIAWLANKEQWLAEGMGSWPTGWRGSQPEQRACSYNLSCHLGQEEGQLSGGGGPGPGGTSAVPLYLMPLFPP